MFVQFLDLSPLRSGQSPRVWGRRETYPGLGNRPTDRWALEESFCDKVFVRIYEEIPTPLGAFVEIGLQDPETGHRLDPMTAEGDHISFVALKGPAILEPGTPAAPLDNAADYVLDGSIGLHTVDVSLGRETLVVTTTWQSLDAVAYDAFIFGKVWDDKGDVVASVDRPPLDGRYPTFYWVPGSWVTDVLTFDVGNATGLETFSLGMYTWPDMNRLPVVDAAGNRPRDNLIEFSLVDLRE
jgi:hypothetical protein